ncbi:MAG: TrmH family RNA methyltransferase [Candidatus Cyclobacteriaceae bacterium M3_2C_046]
MISRTKAKFIKSLQIKKYRQKEQAFFVEGAKSVLELINADFDIIMLLGTHNFLQNYHHHFIDRSIDVLEVSPQDLVKLGTFKSNQEALAVAKAKPNVPLALNQRLTLVLDDIRDPGNLGTIIRVADWYGIHELVVSNTSADLYNPKVLNASMGSFLRVNLFYADLSEFLPAQSQKHIMGAYLEGENIRQVKPQPHSIVVIGNEARGIDTSLQPWIQTRITIPGKGQAESLNAAVATAVICENLLYPRKL